jgi:hypothetical protein
MPIADRSNTLHAVFSGRPAVLRKVSDLNLVFAGMPFPAGHAPAQGRLPRDE